MNYTSTGLKVKQIHDHLTSFVSLIHLTSSPYKQEKETAVG
jgi:hypothetical protein